MSERVLAGIVILVLTTSMRSRKVCWHLLFIIAFSALFCAFEVQADLIGIREFNLPATGRIKTSLSKFMSQIHSIDQVKYFESVSKIVVLCLLMAA